MIRFLPALLAALLTGGPASAQTDSWPSRPIRLIAPFPPASTVDVVSRIIGQKLSQQLGQQIVIDNRVGASGNIGADAIAKAAPDGYTIGVVTNSTHAVAVTLTPNLPYDPLKDFTPITMIANTSYVLVVYPGLAAKTIPELVALAKSKPGVLNYGSAGPASLAHLAGALFATLSDIQMTHVPYKSSAQSVVDIISGRLDMQFATIAPTLANIRANQLRPLATTGLVRAETLPDVPTMDEAGVKGYEATLWFALMAPPGLPPAVAARLNKETIEALKSPEVKAALAQQGFVADPAGPDALMAKIRSDIAKWRDVIGKAGIKPE
jgi:tripartite-type tricarboxylate transporter receptor subunit TctC